MTRIRIFIAAIAALAAGLGLVAMAGAASAAPAWHRHHSQFRPEQFDVILANDEGGTNVNAVNALGPVFIRAGDDVTISPVIDHFRQDPADFVIVDHQELGTPTIDLRTCTVSFTLTDAPWRFQGGLGRFAGARGYGVFDLQAMFSFKEFYGRCSLNGLSSDQINGLIQGGDQQGQGGYEAPMTSQNDSITAYCHRHHIPVPVLLADDVFVQGTGWASLREAPKPYPTPTETVTPVYSTSPASA